MKTTCPVKYTLEYIFVASPKLVYNYISTAQGLADWFADNVTIRDNVYIFHWEDSEQKALMSSKKENEYVRFKWIEEDISNYFEMRIDTNSVSNEVTLIITDFAFENEKEEAVMVWNGAIKKLLRTIGGKLVNLT
jgi:uncharacterized protein YndB with AHSA1/START domain